MIKTAYSTNTPIGEFKRRTIFNSLSDLLSIRNPYRRLFMEELVTLMQKYNNLIKK